MIFLCSHLICASWIEYFLSRNPKLHPFELEKVYRYIKKMKAKNLSTLNQIHVSFIFIGVSIIILSSLSNNNKKLYF